MRATSLLPYSVYLGNFSSRTIWYDAYWSIKAAVDGAELFDAGGSSVPRNVSKLEMFAGGGPSTGSELRAGQVVMIVDEELADHWQLAPGAYTLVVTLNVGPPNGPRVATLTASTKFTVLPK